MIKIKISKNKNPTAGLAMGFEIHWNKSEPDRRAVK
jgi:hypothetical protein